MPEEFVLDPDEVAEAGRIIRGTPPGLYTLAKLYGAEWDMKLSPTTFGARFKASVVAGRLGGISLHPEKTGANALQYRVYDQGR
ncbi:hypothetical protein [Brevundimonas vancanneytii]|uniref:Uncharacterized protein n=1 Tax=Brevundimonas vancanneytii TaxID=1325724 RepID=A0A4P1KJW3_9CAUL|nr:hypothetical protein [Brevundimonas vancanneytii]VTO19759.1 Uncharacterised protein [Brevundimonas vancanneytii]